MYPFSITDIIYGSDSACFHLSLKISAYHMKRQTIYRYLLSVNPPWLYCDLEWLLTAQSRHFCYNSQLHIIPKALYLKFLSNQGKKNCFLYLTKHGALRLGIQISISRSPQIESKTQDVSAAAVTAAKAV